METRERWSKKLLISKTFHDSHHQIPGIANRLTPMRQAAHSLRAFWSFCVLLRQTPVVTRVGRSSLCKWGLERDSWSDLKKTDPRDRRQAADDRGPQRPPEAAKQRWRLLPGWRNRRLRGLRERRVWVPTRRRPEPGGGRPDRSEMWNVKQQQQRLTQFWRTSKYASDAVTDSWFLSEVRWIITYIFSTIPSIQSTIKRPWVGGRLDGSQSRRARSRPRPPPRPKNSIASPPRGARRRLLPRSRSQNT